MPSDLSDWYWFSESIWFACLLLGVVLRWYYRLLQPSTCIPKKQDEKLPWACKIENSNCDCTVRGNFGQGWSKLFGITVRFQHDDKLLPEASLLNSGMMTSIRCLKEVSPWRYSLRHIHSELTHWANTCRCLILSLVYMFHFSILINFLSVRHHKPFSIPCILRSSPWMHEIHSRSKIKHPFKLKYHSFLPDYLLASLSAVLNLFSASWWQEPPRCRYGNQYLSLQC